MSDLAQYTGDTCSWYDLPCHASSFAEWLFGILLFIPRKLFELLTDGLAQLVGSLPPIPGIDLITANASVLATGGYVADLVALSEGVAVMLAALTLRFILRRIPFIG